MGQTEGYAAGSVLNWAEGLIQFVEYILDTDDLHDESMLKRFKKTLNKLKKVACNIGGVVRAIRDDRLAARRDDPMSVRQGTSGARSCLHPDELPDVFEKLDEDRHRMVRRMKKFGSGTGPQTPREYLDIVQFTLVHIDLHSRNQRTSLINITVAEGMSLVNSSERRWTSTTFKKTYATKRARVKEVAHYMSALSHALFVVFMIHCRPQAEMLFSTVAQSDRVFATAKSSQPQHLHKMWAAYFSRAFEGKLTLNPTLIRKLQAEILVRNVTSSDDLEKAATAAGQTGATLLSNYAVKANRADEAAREGQTIYERALAKDRIKTIG